MQQPDLHGKTALVTGGGRGIGREVALKLAGCGARVVVTARHSDEIEAVADEVRGLGGEALAIPCDVSRDDLVRVLFETAGQVDILINNHGTIAPIVSVVDADPAEWERDVTVNLVGAFLTCHYALPGMVQQGWGRIVNVTSGAARGSTANWSAYSASKGAVEVLTKVLALEVSATGVTANCVRPGIVDTDMQREIRSTPAERFGEANVAKYRGYHERGVLRPPEHPARLILWCLTPEADQINGDILVIDDPETASRVGLQPIAR